MAQFRYRAVSPQGQVHQGQIEALHELDLQAQLQGLGLSLLRARPLRPREFKRLSRRELISLLLQLEMLVRAGVPLLEALGDLRQSSESSPIRALAAGVSEKIVAGSTLGEALGAYPGVFSDTLRHLIRCAEAAGQLAQVLQEIVQSLKWQEGLSRQTQRLALYPSFVLVVVGAVLVFLLLHVVPQLVGFLGHMGQAIPLQTRLLIGVSTGLQTYGWAMALALGLCVALALALAAAFEGVRYRWHALELALPVLGVILRKLALARFADTLALLYRTGVPLADALGYCEKISANLVLQQALRRARERVLHGTPLSQSFAAERLFPALVIRMLKLGEATGDLDTALHHISEFYGRDVDESVARVQALIEPVLTVVVGLLLGWIMLAVLGPIYDTLGQLKI